MKRIILTFDDGPNPPYTSQILDVLKKNKAKAIFFLLGHNVKLHPRTALRIKKEGHIIGNHSFSHEDLQRLTKAEVKTQIEKTEDVFQDILGIKPKVFRAPYGSYNKKVKSILKSKGYKIINWGINPKDWKNPPAKVTVKRVISRAKPNNVIVLQDGSNIRQGKSRKQTVVALKLIIKKLKNKGFVFDTASYL